MPFLFTRSAAIDPVTGDKVLPLRLGDSSEVLPKISLDFTLCFDDVLDVDKLRSSLEHVAQVGHWGQIGARYKKNSKGKLEVHLPQQFDEGRPAVAWSHDNRQESINDNKIARNLPGRVGVSQPTLYKDASEYNSLVVSQDRPKKMSQWIETDHPALSVHITSFTDATLISLSWNHVLFDALGRQSLLDAWQAALNGRDQDIPACIAPEEDPIARLAEGADPREHYLYSLALTGVWFALFVIGYIYELVMHSKESGRMVRFPKAWVDELRKDAIADLRAKGVAEDDAFLSHGDVLLSFWCKTCLAAQRLWPSQPVHVMNVMNIRGVARDLPLPGKTAYIGNAASSSDTLLTMAEIDNFTVGELAARVRADLKKSRTLEQVKAKVAWDIENHVTGRQSAPPGPWNQHLFSWSNWSRAKFYNIDFSSAVIKSGLSAKDRASLVGQPSLILVSGHTDGINLRNAGPLIGQDANGDWWLDWHMRAEAWNEIEKMFATG
ncbi:hypothetical protein E8E13_000637 [Curvularia kusanoi]|uniref:Uncharacterized protein n=1 Tax=Curvularia kusanoi TaxID=90978 RepID=A0A9P4T5B0_CURKU|nr:hypothetical protein E8E13_000637 [Curvularia kusanoi]